MTFQEAVRTNKKFKRPAWNNYVTTSDIDDEEFTVNDALATDYEVEPDDVAVSITAAKLKAAWNAARASTNGVKPMGESEFSKKFFRELLGRDYR